MSIINFEVEEVSKICENVIQNSKIVVCNESLVRVNIEQTKSRQIIVCLRFPTDYPHQILLIELKSRTLSLKFLEGLTSICEQRVKEFIGKPQIIVLLKFIAQYLIENPLCIVFDEIIAIKQLINGTGSELKLKQKQSSIILIARGGKYYFKLKIEIPKEYPEKCIKWQEIYNHHNHYHHHHHKQQQQPQQLQQKNFYESNLPTVLIRYLNGQAKETARQCCEPPLKRSKDKSQETFKPIPSLLKTFKFIIDATQNFCEEICTICRNFVLPENPEQIILDDTHPMCVERVYCGHLFHQGCLKKYMQEPPFPAGGKLCPATKKHPRSDDILSNVRSTTNSCGGSSGVNIPNGGSSVSGVIQQKRQQQSTSDECGLRIAHDRWGINVKVAETRWAQKQARERELEEVVDFLK